MEKKVLIVGVGKPNYGGASTTMYNLEKLLSNDFEVKLVYIDTDINALGSDRIIYKNIIRINSPKHITVMVYNFLRNIYTELFKQLKMKVYKPRFLRNFVANSKLLSFGMKGEIKRILLENKFSPDIMISNLPTKYFFLSSFNIKHKILIVNGSVEMNELANKNLDYNSFLNNKDLSKNVKLIYSYNFKKLSVIYNSLLTKNIYDRFGIQSPNSSIKHFNLTPHSISLNRAFHERKFDIAYFVSNTSRKIKNAKLAFDLFEQFPDVNKLCVGLGTSFFKSLEKIEIHDLISQDSVYEIMNNVKLVIIPSFYDSSPGVMTEALLRGCNVLVSKNIGWNEYLAKECVVEEFSDINEWYNKAKFLMHKYQKNDTTIQLFKDSPETILAFFKSLS